ncbi:MAG: Gx transporter family protein [Bacillota bacterium]
MNTKDISIIAMLSVLAALTGYIESLLLVPIVPGAKLGFANIISIYAIYKLAFRHLIAIILVRTMLTSILLGTFLSVGYFLSFSGAVVSGLAMYLIYKKFARVSLVFLSIIGAILHNLAQMAVAYFFIGYAYVYFLPYLVLMAVPSGCIVGFISQRIIQQSNMPAYETQNDDASKFFNG